MKVTDRGKITNAFEFVTMSGERARQLLRGCTPRTEGSLKPARLAQKEVMEGKITRVRTEAAAE